MKTILIPLDRLRLADTNMRATRPAVVLDELKASLLVHGQLQPILVTRHGTAFAVIAGARRTLAARALVAEGKWPATARLSAVCRRAGSLDPCEISLAENLQRVAPCVADEAVAVARLVEQGADPAALATRFGRPLRTIRQRLALAALSPRVLAARRSDEITPAVAEALTLSRSHAQQDELLARVLDQTPPDAARYIRAILRRTRLPTANALPGVREAYLAAGGTLTRDLFDEADGGLVDDPALFLSCQRAALQAEVERRRADWGFVELRDGPDAWNWRRAYRSLAPGDGASPDLDRRRCGVLAVLGADGAVTWIEGVERRRPAAPPPAKPAGGAPCLDDIPPWEELPAAERSADALSLSAAVRAASLQAAVLASPALALRLACFALFAPGQGPCRLYGGDPRLPAGRSTLQASWAWAALERSQTAWMQRLGLPPDGGVPDPLALWRRLGDPAVTLPALFAWLVARHCRLGHGEAGLAMLVAQALGVSVAGDWRPDAVLLERLPMAMLAEVAQAIALAFAASLAGRPKAEMAERLARCLQADGTADWPALTGGTVSAARGTLQAARLAAARWLPPGTAVAGADAGAPAAADAPALAAD
ncbi:ParB/RepB/Spo0J family partition protein [Azospirillum picis]|uniref:ParB family chromosome partitioning protein n=1 Tax=Azospirillum picis TaxID=488438 RepID=A0ABU0MUN6_9PROT|nr:ParB N-terminal domain-containing protein [Azospirillum picis]MBP2300930.1 ParB family chromosome partitioning protein [Azospirillum picis]MDQ0537034.1 ParB family chromosome partitioning protein [Azospirillum picis]